MFLVMNRFQINAGREADFEASWRNRDRHLQEFEGFVSFALLKNEAAGDTVEYISHTVWRAKADFEAWRSSQAFSNAHAGAPVQGVIAGPPHASLYEAIIEEHNPAATTAP